jgi:tetratricopeptide (TPR) repeat protein
MNLKDKRYNDGVALLKAEKFEAAITHFNHLINDFPDEADFYSERGVVYFHMKNKKASLADMDKAVELQPLKSYRYSSRAFIKGAFKLTKEAISDYAKAIDLDPDDAVAQNNLGLLEEQLGYQKSSLKRFKIADELAERQPGSSDQGIMGNEINARNIQKEIEAENDRKNIWTELKSIGSKDGINSFKRFISSGFKKT